MKTTLNIKGMHCASCSKIIEMELAGKVKKVSVNHETGKAEIDFDEKNISLQQIKEIIKQAGYKVD